MKLILLLFPLWLTASTLYAQFNYTFETNSELSNWEGDTSHFIIIDGKLKLNGNGGSSILTHASSAIDSATWEFDFNLSFNPSSNNYFTVYLISSSNDIDKASGYFLKVGGNKDNLALYKFDNTSTQIIIEGVEGRVNFSTVDGSIRISRSIDGEWKVFSRINNDLDYVLEGKINDNTFNSTSHFSIQCIYTTTRKDKFYFDNIKVKGQPYSDRISPYMKAIESLTKNVLRVYFNEQVELDNSTIEVIPLRMAPDSAIHNQEYSDLIFLEDLPNATPLELEFSNIRDMNGNETKKDRKPFFCFYHESVLEKDIIFSEIMPDPSPPVDLPELEYIEIFNSSDKHFNLEGWFITDKTTYARLDSLIVSPGEYILLVPKHDDEYTNQPYQSMITEKWPSLNNSGDSILIFSKDSTLIDLVVYNLDNYQDEAKSAGGWSLEIIDPFLPCNSRTNWSESNHSDGGTPGFKNSHTNFQNVSLIEYRISPQQLLLTFSKRIDCSNITYSLPFIDSATIHCEDNSIIIEGLAPIKTDTYTLNFDNVKDCYGRSYDFSISIKIDFSAPEIISTSNIYNNQIEIVFNEPVSEIYQLSANGIEGEIIRYPGRPDSISFVSDNLMSRTLQLEIDLEDSLKNRASYFYDVVLKPSKVAGYGDLVISEYLPSPLESTPLPQFEFIEIFNRTSEILPLRGYQIGDDKRYAKIKDGFIKPGEYLILCPTSAFEDFSQYGKVIPISRWSAINNDNDKIILKNSDGIIISQVEYDQNNFNHVFGSGTVEKIDLNRFCSNDDNWGLSSNTDGGTPGFKNSNSQYNPDRLKPFVIESFQKDSNQIRISFNEPLFPSDSFNLKLSPYIKLDSIRLSRNNSYDLFFAESFNNNTIYSFNIDRIRDCNNNYSNSISGEIIVPGHPEKGNLIINEILFEPDPLVTEFIEIYNASEVYIDLSKIDLWINNKAIGLMDDIIKPYEIKVLTKDPESLLNKYPNSLTNALQKFNLPSLRNDSSSLKMVFEEVVLDSARYDSDWHFELIDEPKGVSLERISIQSDGYQKSSWFSASKTSGYATPGKMNSHSISKDAMGSMFSVSPKSISPNNDGFQDIAFISYKIDKLGVMANLKIFDIRGNLIKVLANNSLLQTEGYFTWDGTSDINIELKTNYYILFVELYDNNGFLKRERFKIGLFQNNF